MLWKLWKLCNCILLNNKEKKTSQTVPQIVTFNDYNQTCSWSKFAVNTISFIFYCSPATEFSRFVRVALYHRQTRVRYSYILIYVSHCRVKIVFKKNTILFVIFVMLFSHLYSPLKACLYCKLLVKSSCYITIWLSGSDATFKQMFQLFSKWIVHKKI